MLEALCIRDLRVYANSLDADVYHYRDARGVEVDAIIQMNDGRWGAVEVKMFKKLRKGRLSPALSQLCSFP